MNYDPIRFCVHCQHPRQRESFRWLPGVKPKREVCEVCYAAIMAARERVKERA